MTTTLPQLLTVQQVAEWLGKHPDTIRRLMDNGEIPFFKLGATRYVKSADLDFPTSPSPATPAGSLPLAGRGSSLIAVPPGDGETPGSGVTAAVEPGGSQEGSH